MRYSVIYQNNTLTLWNNCCSFSRNFAHVKRDDQPSFLQICFHDFTLLWTTMVLTDKLGSQFFFLSLNLDWYANYGKSYDLKNMEVNLQGSQ